MFLNNLKLIKCILCFIILNIEYRQAGGTKTIRVYAVPFSYIKPHLSFQWPLIRHLLLALAYSTLVRSIEGKYTWLACRWQCISLANLQRNKIIFKKLRHPCIAWYRNDLDKISYTLTPIQK